MFFSIANWQQYKKSNQRRLDMNVSMSNNFFWLDSRNNMAMNDNLHDNLNNNGDNNNNSNNNNNNSDNSDTNSTETVQLNENTNRTNQRI